MKVAMFPALAAPVVRCGAVFPVLVTWTFCEIEAGCSGFSPPAALLQEFLGASNLSGACLRSMLS